MYAYQRLCGRPRCTPVQGSTSDQHAVVSPAHSRPRIAICCEFAAMHEAATAASRELEVSAMASASPSGTARDAPLQIRPTHGDRVIHKELRSLVKQIEMGMAANRCASASDRTEWGFNRAICLMWPVPVPVWQYFYNPYISSQSGDSSRRANGPFELHLTSWQSESDIDVFGKYLQVHSWPVILHEAALLDVFSTHEVAHQLQAISFTSPGPPHMNICSLPPSTGDHVVPRCHRASSAA